MIKGNKERIQAIIKKFTRRITLPGFGGIPLYDVAVFFIRGILKGYITSRAAAISFSFFLAVFPFLIFLFTIIPFVPIANFQQTLLALLEELMPGIAYDSVKATIIDVITRPRSGLLIFNFILSLYFSTNGVNSLIEGFNSTYHDIETRSTIRQYLVALLLVIILSLLLIISVGLITFGSTIIDEIIPVSYESSLFVFYTLLLFKWLLTVGLLLTAISFLYYLAPARHARFRFISTGSMLATLLIICTTLGFNFYVDHFSQYNALYGSIGTLLVVMMWIYLNALSMLIGFELNASIKIAGSGELLRTDDEVTKVSHGDKP